MVRRIRFKDRFKQPIPFLRQNLKRQQKRLTREAGEAVGDVALLGRSIINTPRTFGRFKEFKKPIIDKPSQLKKKRFRSFAMMPLPGFPLLIKGKR